MNHLNILLLGIIGGFIFMLGLELEDRSYHVANTICEIIGIVCMVASVIVSFIFFV